MKTHTSSSVSSLNKENAISSMDSSLFARIKDEVVMCNIEHEEEEEEQEADEVERMHLRALRICREHLGGAWKKISPAEMSFSPVSGGMSNALYCCSLPESIKVSNGEPSRVLLRFYGNQFKNCDMSTQEEIFNILSKHDLGPKLYGKFADGRLEEFLPANSMTNEELMNPEMSAIIAKKLAIVHSLDVPIIDKTNIWLTQRFKEYAEFVKKQNNPNLKLKFKEGTRESTMEISRELMAINYNKEIKFLNGIFNRTRSPIVFSHNDLHQGNILLAKCSKKRPTLQERIVFIDFEYCSYNYRAYDIANHFCEWAFQYDTPEYPHFDFFDTRFPNETVQRQFVRHYLEEHKRQLANATSPNLIDDNPSNTPTNNKLNLSLFSNSRAPEVAAAKRPALNGNSNAAFLKPADKSDDDQDTNNNNNNNNNDSYHFEDSKKLKAANGRTKQYRQVDLNCDTNGLSPMNKMKESNGQLRKTACPDTENNHSLAGLGQSLNLDVDEQEVSELYEEFQPFFMMANFLWTLWSIKSAQCSQINFGYWEHAMARWQLYKKFKSAYVEQQLRKNSTNNNNDNNNQTRRK